MDEPGSTNPRREKLTVPAESGPGEEDACPEPPAPGAAPTTPGPIPSVPLPPPPAAPIGISERIDSLDVLRGVAVLGILTMNIVTFGMVDAAYLNPYALGEPTRSDYTVWLVNHLLADQKFMTIFSILFGAGIVVFTSRLAVKGRRPAGLHYRRMFWLLVFGMFHAYLLWYGDILVSYAICGMAVYPFRRLKPGWQVLIAVVPFLIPVVLSFLTACSMQFWPPEAIDEMASDWAPSAETVREQVAVYQGSWIEQMSHRAPKAFWMQTFLVLFWTLWRVSACMLLGMALFKLGVLSARRSGQLYVLGMLFGVGLGGAIITHGVQLNLEHQWDMEYSMFLGSTYNYFGSLLVALGWISLVMVVCKTDAVRRLTRPLAAVGRMAFTNYIMQTVICTTIFYGHGFGLYGTLSRLELLYIVLAVWAFQLVLSPIWLHFFRFGPAEWLWRSLVYWRAQPIRVRAA